MYFLQLLSVNASESFNGVVFMCDYSYGLIRPLPPSIFVLNSLNTFWFYFGEISF